MNNEMYCPACAYDSLKKFPKIYELKSKSSPMGRSILDGAYYAALERIASSTNPNLFVLHYDKNVIEVLTVIPKHFFTPDILKIRRALLPTAKRAGYIGSVIMYRDIPEQGKIAVISSHTELNRNTVLTKYAAASMLRVDNMNLRGWLMDIMRCVDKIAHDIFSLEDLYKFERELSIKHPDNHNITAKIRQQLQFLRDKGFIEFVGRGRYRKL